MNYRLEELTEIINDIRCKLTSATIDDRSVLENDLKKYLQELNNINESIHTKSKLLKG